MSLIATNRPEWLNRLLSDPLVTDVLLNGTKKVVIDRGDQLEEISLREEECFTEERLKEWILAELSQVGRTWDAKHPFVDAVLTSSGHRVHVVFPPMIDQIHVSLRRLPRPEKKEKGLRWKNSPLYSVVASAIKRGDSILISGATGSGKTTLASDLLEEISDSERIIAIEDTAELAPHHPHFLSLLSRVPNADGFGEVTLRTLLKQTLRMRPDRIVLGECRGDEVLELLQALNTGHRGALATLHANSPRDALRRIELLCLLAAGGTIPKECVSELLELGVQWIVQVERKKGERSIVGVQEIKGREGSKILLKEVQSI